jgi:DNA-binding transcriptional MerR regulator
VERLADERGGRRRVLQVTWRLSLDLAPRARVYPLVMAREGLLIGEVAKRSGASRKALRLYEQAGILPPAPRTEAGYRVYGAEALDLLAFVRQAQRLGFTLEEIKETVFDPPIRASTVPARSRSGTAEAGGPRSPACRSRRCPQAARRGAPRLAVAVRNGGCVPPRRAGRRPESSIRPRRNPFKEEAMIRAIAWTLTVLAVIAAYAAIGPTPIAAACPPTPECPCP